MLLPLIFLSGCGTPMNPSFNRLSASYAQALSAYQVDGILSNVVRAAEDRPLNFLDIPSINGSGNVSHSHAAYFSLGALSATNFYGAITSASVGPSISLGTGFNFTQSSLDNATFWAGFSTPVSLKGVHNYRHSYLPREVLFILAIDSIEFKRAGDRVAYYDNQVTDANYDQFTKIFYELMEAGLDIEPVPVSSYQEVDKVKVSPKPKEQQGHLMASATPSANPQSLSGSNSMGSPQYGGYGAPQMGSLQNGAYGSMQMGTSYGNQSPIPNFKWCLKRELAIQGARDRFDSSQYCESKQVAISGHKGLIFEINLRSPKHIFNFSGDVVRAQNEKNGRMLVMRPLSDTRYKRSDGSNNNALLVVQKNPSAELETYSLVSGSYDDSYAIPRINNGYTPLVIDFLSQLIVFNKVNGSIPQQPAVLLK